MNINIKGNKGSITLFVAMSTMFFLMLIASITAFMKNRERAVETEYIQIKQSYEQDIDKEDEIYESIISEQ